MSTFYPLSVTAVSRLTPDAVAVTFKLPEDLKDTFTFTAGQYLTIKHIQSDTELRRAYSIASRPNDNELVIGIKKVPGGRFSAFANDTLKAGDVLEVMPPQGRFIYPHAPQEKTFLAVAAGSGITPIMSILKSALEQDSETKFVLLYGNRSMDETMFREELQNLATNFPNRFTLHYIFSRQREEEALFGRIESSTINYVVKNKHKDLKFDRVYLCGPQAMIETAQDSLSNLGIAPESISLELFTEVAAEDTLKDELIGKTQVSVTLDGVSYQLIIDQKSLLLDGILKQKIDAPYSCQGGVCSTCIAKITEGEAKMVKNQILTPGEIADGLILTCQAHATTPTLKIDFDDV
jgi:ring-1,2-phenylacetyl-CoA epoxidase subunit PaaE